MRYANINPKHSLRYAYFALTHMATPDQYVARAESGGSGARTLDAQFKDYALARDLVSEQLSREIAAELAEAREKYDRVMAAKRADSP